LHSRDEAISFPTHSPHVSLVVGFGPCTQFPGGPVLLVPSQHMFKLLGWSAPAMGSTVDIRRVSVPLTNPLPVDGGIVCPFVMPLQTTMITSCEPFPPGGPIGPGGPGGPSWLTQKGPVCLATQFPLTAAVTLNPLLLYCSPLRSLYD